MSQSSAGAAPGAGTAPSAGTTAAAAASRWRTVDIVVAAVIAVVFGVIFWAWDQVWSLTSGAFSVWPPAQAIIYGVWLLPAVLAAVVIRKPGAATFTETVAAIISALLGNKWGPWVVPQGVIEGFAVELAFILARYRSYRLTVALLGGVLGGLAATIFDAFVWYPGYGWQLFRLPYIVLGTLSCAIVAGIGAVYLSGALAATGALDRFPSGREREPV